MVLVGTRVLERLLQLLLGAAATVAVGDRCSRVTSLSALYSANWKDQEDLMPILTPAYPSQNAAFNVTRSTLHRIQAEIKRGLAR
jgi:hypothetical protein